MPNPESVADPEGGGVPETPFPAEPQWRRRVRNSPVAVVGVLVLTAVAVALGLWISQPNLPSAATDPAETDASGKVSAVDIAASDPPQIGKVPPDFSLESALGPTPSASRLSELKSKPTWVLFAATWCSGCRVEMPDVAQAAAKHQKDLQVIVVYLGEDTAAVKGFMDRTNLELTGVPDPGAEIGANWGIMGIPAHFFLDSDGVLQATRVGVLNPESIEENLKQILD